MTPDRKTESAVPASVNVRGLRQDYGKVTALHTVDLDIAGGEFVSLLGPSGCGKTTLLRCIAGLIMPTAGEILVAGASIARMPVHRRNLGLVFQSYALFPHMTVADNIAFGLRMRRTGAPETRQRVAEMLELIHMGSFGGRYPSELSGGQQQRVALARSLVTRPSVLLLDEPFGALDAKLRTSMQIELRRMQRQLNVTTIFVTHDQQEALSMSDRIAVLNQGRVHQFDGPTQIYNAPKTPFVAEFIGQVNSLNGAIASLDGAPALALGSLVVPLPRDAAFAAGAAVTAMVRPERVHLAPQASAAPQGAIAVPATVTDVMFTGETIFIFLDTPIGKITASQKNLERGEPLSAGDRVIAHWRPDDMFLFPAA